MNISNRFNKFWKYAITIITFLTGIILMIVGHWMSLPPNGTIVNGEMVTQINLHQFRIAEFAGPLIEKLGEFLLLVVSLHFLYETFVKDLDNQEHLDALKKQLEPLEQNVTTIKANLDSLYDQTKLVLNLVSYTDTEQFDSQLKLMAERFDKFWLIGNIPTHYLDEIFARNTKARVFLYTTVNDRNREDLANLIEKFGEQKSDNTPGRHTAPEGEELRTIDFRAFHVSRFDWGFTVIASNLQENEAEALINYNTSPTESPVGYFMFGDTAIALHKSVGKRLAGTTSYYSATNDFGAIQIENKYLLKYLAARRFAYMDELKDATEGVNLIGDEYICNQMSELLGNCKETLDVTHIARKGSIDLLEGNIFRNWLKENYDSITDRNIRIRRIFLIERNELENPTLQNCMKTQTENNIEVRYCFLDKIEPNLEQDFSIYDGRFLVYICHKTGGAWRDEKGEDKNQAKLSSNPDKIFHFEEIYNQLLERSKIFNPADFGSDVPPKNPGDA